MKYCILFLFLALFGSCQETTRKQFVSEIGLEVPTTVSETSLVILGTIQDAGSPHIACKKECCAGLFENPDPDRKVVSLGVIDPEHNQSFLFEATPDISTQVKALKQYSKTNKELPDGVFVTHAHIGHYTGLMYLGKEATNAQRLPVYAMPKMKTFLETNGPWSQLVANQNISIKSLQNNEQLFLTPNLKVVPIQVPHRDEFSETVGYKIIGPKKTALFIPDIDKWEKWAQDISEEIAKVDYAFLDATFYDGEEINTRDISEIPHPFIIESMEKFEELANSEKKKIYFIHFNHTNPVINSNSKAHETVIENGFNIATIHTVLSL
mgnify:CR=1 FL=1